MIIGYSIASVVSTLHRYLYNFSVYSRRVIADLGSVQDSSLTKTVYRDLPAQDNIVFAWFGGAGSKKRVSTIYSYFTKLYSLFGTNDATQTTENSQPFVTGNIAPNENEGMLNPNGGSRFMNHPIFSFDSNEAWSVTTIVNSNFVSEASIGSTESRQNYIFMGNFNNYGFYLGRVEADVEIYDNNGPDNAVVLGSSINFDAVGKNSIITIIYTGTKCILYRDGEFIDEKETNLVNVSFAGLFGGRPFYGKISADIIRNIALTSEQVLSEHNLLRSIYPEIPSVKIGTQEWATSNFDAVATPMGTVVQEMQAAANVEKITGGDFEDGLIGTKLDEDGSESTWELNTTDPISGTQDGLLSIITATTGRPKLTFPMSTIATGKWIKFSFDYSVVSGSPKLGYFNQAGTSIIVNEVFSETGTFVFYILQGANPNVFQTFWRDNTGVIQIDNVSVQEVGWSDSQNLYDAIYAQTTGTAAEKEYAALKAAAMWCYYNNDATIGAVYKKLYNWFAVKLLQTDIDLYNAANPTTPWGWRLSLDTDWDTLETEIGEDTDKLKEASESYWDENTGTNETGFTALPAGWRDNLGTFSEINEVSAFWNSDEPIEDEDKVMGLSIRIIEE